MAEMSIVVRAEEEEALGWCLNSLVGQTLRDIEIVLLCPKDTSSAEICHCYAALDERIKIVYIDDAKEDLCNIVGNVVGSELVYVASGSIVLEESLCFDVVELYKQYSANMILLSMQKMYKNGLCLTWEEKHMEDEGKPWLVEGEAVAGNLPQLYLREDWISLMYNKVFDIKLLKSSFANGLPEKDWEEMLVLWSFEQSKRVLFAPKILCREVVPEGFGERYEPDLLRHGWRICEEMNRIEPGTGAAGKPAWRQLQELRTEYVWRGLLMLYHLDCPLTEEEKLEYARPALGAAETLEAYEACANKKREYAEMTKCLRKKDYRGALLLAEETNWAAQGQAGVLNKGFVAGARLLQRLAKRDSATYKKARDFQRRLQTVGIVQGFRKT